MALKIDDIEDKLIHKRPGIIRGWEFHNPRSIDEVFWGERLLTHSVKFHPIQMRFVYPKFSVINEESVKGFVSELKELLSTATREIDKVCREYVEKISDIEALREILVVEEEEEVTTIWTIIKAPPFEDSVREPIYNAQLQILRSLEQDIPINFYILNESELPSDEELSDIIPSNARSIWRR